jgi:hypothetical protein
MNHDTAFLGLKYIYVEFDIFENFVTITVNG